MTLIFAATWACIVLTALVLVLISAMHFYYFSELETKIEDVKKLKLKKSAR